MKDLVFEIHLPRCLPNYILFFEVLSTYSSAWLAFFCLPISGSTITYCICSQISTVGLLSTVEHSERSAKQQSLQAVAFLVSIPGGSCLSSTWITPSESTRCASLSLSPPDGNATARGLLHLVGGKQTALSLLQVISMWKFTLLQVISKSFPFHGWRMCLEECSCLLLSSSSFFFFLLFSLLIFFYITYCCLQLACSFVICLFYIKAGFYFLLCIVIIHSKV